LRQVSSADLACDVTQSVFTDLARSQSAVQAESKTAVPVQAETTAAEENLQTPDGAKR